MIFKICVKVDDFVNYLLFLWNPMSYDLVFVVMMRYFRFLSRYYHCLHDLNQLKSKKNRHVDVESIIFSLCFCFFFLNLFI